MMQKQSLTDIGTAKKIAQELFATYSSHPNSNKKFKSHLESNSIESAAIEKMMIDTYRLIVLKNLVEGKEYRPTSQDCQIYQRILDVNSDGKVTIEDFVALAVKHLVKPENRPFTKSVQQRLQQGKVLFDKHKVPGTDYLTIKELPNLVLETYKMINMEGNPTLKDIENWMEMMDLDCDGKVIIEDYERFIIASLEKCGIRIYERN